ncbi:hypothetical protein [Paraburkholderia bannensis]|uniref:hypothetical protein n=1 Tax=Paraburkholderia bannensis TaxID=765414 RepID=UPI002AB77091|nr:hypothetical protein [Paraburkholderia bannensis]
MNFRNSLSVLDHCLTDFDVCWSHALAVFSIAEDSESLGDTDLRRAIAADIVEDLDVGVECLKMADQRLRPLRQTMLRYMSALMAFSSPYAA